MVVIGDLLWHCANPPDYPKFGLGVVPPLHWGPGPLGTPEELGGREAAARDASSGKEKKKTENKKQFWRSVPEQETVLEKRSA